jgi:uncharacterized protein (DUF305 family)
VLDWPNVPQPNNEEYPMNAVEVSEPTRQMLGVTRTWASTSARRLGLVAVVLGVVVAFMAGYVLRARIGPRPVAVAATPSDTAAEAGFARDMSAHHAQAVQLAMIAWQRASLPETRSMAYATVTAQQAQIGMMQDWLRQWRLMPTALTPPMTWIPGGPAMLGADGQMPGMASAADIDRLEHAHGSQVDILFCQLMIRHHLGGLHMIDAILGQSQRPEVIDLARGMKNRQQAEITSLHRMLTELGATA